MKFVVLILNKLVGWETKDTCTKNLVKAAGSGLVMLLLPRKISCGATSLRFWCVFLR